MQRIIWITAICLLSLAGCGEVDWFPEIKADDPASVTVTADKSSPVVGTSVKITATVKKKDGTAVADGKPVSFLVATGVGKVDPSSATTTGGTATTTLTATSAGTATVTASAGIVSGQVSVTFTSPITVTANPTNLTVGNIDVPSTITATVNNTDGTPKSGATVNFVVTSTTGAIGTLNVLSATTDATGKTPALTLTVPVSTTSGTITITATDPATNISGTATVTVTKVL